VRPVVIRVVHVPRLIKQEQERVRRDSEVQLAVDPGAHRDIEHVALDERHRPVNERRVGTDRHGQRVRRRRMNRPQQGDQV